MRHAVFAIAKIYCHKMDTVHMKDYEVLMSGLGIDARSSRMPQLNMQTHLAKGYRLKKFPIPFLMITWCQPIDNAAKEHYLYTMERKLRVSLQTTSFTLHKRTKAVFALEVWRWWELNFWQRSAAWAGLARLIASPFTTQVFF
jgi:hypothetical protein